MTVTDETPPTQPGLVDIIVSLQEIVTRPGWAQSVESRELAKLMLALAGAVYGLDDRCDELESRLPGDV